MSSDGEAARVIQLTRILRERSHSTHHEQQIPAHVSEPTYPKDERNWSIEKRPEKKRRVWAVIEALAPALAAASSRDLVPALAGVEGMIDSA